MESGTVMRYEKLGYKNSKRILFICPYPLNQAPSQRFRFEQYFDTLGENGFQIQSRPFISLTTWKILYTRGNLLGKTWGLIKGYLKRALVLFIVPHFDYVFIHREASPLGPPWFEYIVAKVFNKKIIYDFDDAIWMSDKSMENGFVKALKWRKKIRQIITWSWKISCGNQFLLDYAIQFNQNSFLNPTTIDTEHLHKIPDVEIPNKKNTIVIGWTGSHSTISYLKPFETVFQTLLKKYSHIILLVISNQKPNLNINSKSLHFVEWNPKSEIEDLLRIDIGIMPLPDDEWSRGKCGFKILQYMSLNIPSVASKVGVNEIIIKNGVNGYLCTTKDEWLSALEELIVDPEHRKQIGSRGKLTVDKYYSVSTNTDNFLDLFE